jgi:hypothetical protein
MYRIIRETIHNKTEYKIQKRFLLLWWVTQRISDIEYGTYDSSFASFTSVEQAERYIRTYCIKPETKIVKYFKL